MKEETAWGSERGHGVEPGGARAGGGARTGDRPPGRDGVGGRQRARSRTWGDPRFLVGIMLVVASVMGVWWLVTASSRTIPVYAASETLTPGTRLDRSSLKVVDARLGSVEDGYLGAGEAPPTDTVVTRTIAEGELVPLAALGESTDKYTPGLSNTFNTQNFKTEYRECSGIAPQQGLSVTGQPRFEYLAHVEVPLSGYVQKTGLLDVAFSLVGEGRDHEEADDKDDKAHNWNDQTQCPPHSS